MTFEKIHWKLSVAESSIESCQVFQNLKLAKLPPNGPNGIENCSTKVMRKKLNIFCQKGVHCEVVFLHSIVWFLLD